jgi:hypothetical protein
MSGLFSVRPGTGTLILCVLVGFITVMYAVIPDLQSVLVMSPQRISEVSLFSIWTNSFVSSRSSFFGLIILVALIGYFMWPSVQGWWYRARNLLIGFAVGGVLLVYGLERLLGSAPHTQGLAIGMVSSMITLVWFGGAVESKWGRRRFLIFSALVITVVNLTACLAAYLMPGTFAPPGGPAIHGSGPMVTAFVTVWCLMYGNMRLAILNIEARKLVWFLVVLSLLQMVFRSPIAGLMDLAAIVVAYLLVSGLWRPRLLLDHLRLRLIENRIRRRRNQIRVVDNDQRYHRN